MFHEINCIFIKILTVTYLQVDFQLGFEYSSEQIVEYLKLKNSESIPLWIKVKSFQKEPQLFNLSMSVIADLRVENNG